MIHRSKDAPDLAPAPFCSKSGRFKEDGSSSDFPATIERSRLLCFVLIPQRPLCFFLCARYDKCVVVSMRRPGSVRHFTEFDKAPVGHVRVLQAKVIPHCRRNIEARALVQVWFWSLVAKNILPVIGAKRSRVFPLRIDGAVAFANRNPAVFANRHRRTLIRILEPWHHTWRFRTMSGPALYRCKVTRNKMDSAAA